MAPRRSSKSELIDSLEHSELDFSQSFQDIRRINRFLGGVRVVQKELRRRIRTGEEASILDLGTGSADIPRSIKRWADANDIYLRIVALDSNRKILNYAASTLAGVCELSLVEGNAAALPFPAGSFDFVISSLTFHHFSDAFALRVLNESARVAKKAIIVNDLQRAYLPAVLIWLVTRLTGMHRLTRNDGPLSVLRSRTLGEYVALGGLLGMGTVEVRRHPFWRAALVIGLGEP